MNDQAWIAVSIFLGLTGTVSGFISLVMNGAEKTPKDPDTIKGKSWYEGYDKGRSAGFSQGVIAGNQSGYEDGKKDAQTTWQHSKDAAPRPAHYQPPPSPSDAELETHYKRGYDNGNKAGYAKGWNEAKLYYEKTSDAKAVLDELQRLFMPKTPEEVANVAGEQLIKMGCRLSRWEWVTFTGQYPGGSKP